MVRDAVVLNSESHKITQHAEKEGRAETKDVALVTNYTLGKDAMEFHEPDFRSVAAPRYLDGHGEIFRASELVGNVNLTYTNALNYSPYTLLDQQLMNPNGFTISRQKVAASLWQRFRYRKVTLEYIPSVSKLVGGQLLMWCDLDPNINISTYAGTEFMSRAAFSREHHLLFNTGDHVAMEITFSGDDYWYYLADGDDTRLNIQALISTMLHASPIFSTVPTTTTTLGSLVLHYEIEFCGATVGDDIVAVPDSGSLTFAASSSNNAGQGWGTLGQNSVITAGYFGTTPAISAWMGTAPYGIYKLIIQSAAAPTYPALFDQDNGIMITLAPGMMIYARLMNNGAGNVTFYHFTSVQSALSGDLGKCLNWGSANEAMSFSGRYTLMYAPPDANG